MDATPRDEVRTVPRVIGAGAGAAGAAGAQLEAS
jgi:hypothetical protein